MNYNKILASVITISALFCGCKEIMIPITDPVIPDSERVVLIEELTGVSCTNCPKGTSAVEGILDSYGDKVIAIGIHGDLLSHPNAKSKYDFRNQKAKDLENWFKPWLGKPMASINRVATNDTYEPYVSSSPDAWKSLVETELQKPHQMNILLESTYDALSRKLDLKVAAIPLVDLSGNYNISVYLTESDIIDAQTNGNVIVPDFKHNHVMRDMLTNFDGDVLGENLVSKSIINRSYTYTLPVTADGLWKAENMDIIVMVSHSGTSVRNVIQAAKKKIIQ